MQYPLKKLSALSAVILAGFLIAGASNNNSRNNSAVVETVATTTSESNGNREAMELYAEMNLDAVGLSAEAFTSAMKGFAKLSVQHVFENDDILTVVDFSQPSNKKRLYVIDLENKEVLFNTLVAHGKNTGTLYATNFSNRPQSLKSSPGFYSTAETYIGENGFSLRLDGLEASNSNARSRAIVMHGAQYVNESFVNGRGFIGRSWGCPAVPMKDHKQIINTIKNGTCLFIYSPDNNYLENSNLLNS